MAEKTSNLYPHLVVENNKKPNRLYAFPVLGIMAKVIVLIPVFLEVLFLAIIAFFVLCINWFVILFTGKYWDQAYRFFLGMMRLGGKIQLFLWGLTDKYPGFTLDTSGLFTLDIPKPEKPNRWLAVPFLGIFVRMILLIPYFIFVEVMERGSGIAMVVSWFAVLFKKVFPESLYEFERDTLRVSSASSAYLIGLSDRYPSFSISMNHQTIKIWLIIGGALLTAWRMSPVYPLEDNTSSSYQYEYKYDRSLPPASDLDAY